MQEGLGRPESLVVPGDFLGVLLDTKGLYWLVGLLCHRMAGNHMVVGPHRYHEAMDVSLASLSDLHVPTEL